jgi:DNA-binding SARP family transcriptional activator
MRKAQALMAYLAVPPGRAHSRDKLASVLWGNTGDEQARQSLRQTLVALRRALPAARPPILIVDRDTLALDPGAVEVDVEAFERAAAGGSAKALEHAVALYQGDLLEGMRVTEEAFEDWLRVERARLRRCAVDALTRLLAYQSRASATEGAVHTAARLLALDPLQESAHRALMRLYARLGRREEALRQYQVCVGVLRRELQAEPDAETKHLYRELVQQTAPRGAIRDASPPPAQRNPAGAAPGPGPHVPTAEGQLIGREAEMARVRQAWEAARLGRGQVVLIVGEAGIGKSRLLAEAAAEATAHGGRFLLGRCYESEQILPFGPWVDAVRTGRIIGDEVLLGTLNPAWRAELTRLVPEVAESGGPAPTDDRLRLFESVMHLVEQLGTTQPAILGLEDLHWADEISLRLLAFVARRIRTAAVLIVATVREDEPGSGEVLRLAAEELDREPHCRSLVLSPLSRADTTALVRTLARSEGDNGVTAARAEQVWAISGGNPFLAVEALRALQEGAMPRESTPELWLPAHIRELVVRRLDRLSSQGQELAAVAAVIGRDFEFALLQRAAGLAEREAAQAMEELVRRRILHGVGERFDFTHDRIREAIATSLLAPRRKVLHGQVATAIEDLYTPQLEPHAAALGTHFRQAESWDKAVRYLRRAGAGAQARSAYREAVAAYEKAIEALARIPLKRETAAESIDLRLDLCLALGALAEWERARDAMRLAQTSAEMFDDTRRMGPVLDRM